MKINRRNVEIAMAKKCYNTSKLAQIYGVSKSRMHAILNSVELATSTVGKLAAALGVDVTDIIE